MGKGEISRNEQFLLFPQCFQLNQITVSPFLYIFDIISLFAFESEEPKIVISGKGLTLHHTIPTLEKKALENTVGKGEYAGNQCFLHIPQCFLLYQGEKSSF